MLHLPRHGLSTIHSAQLTEKPKLFPSMVEAFTISYRSATAYALTARHCGENADGVMRRTRWPAIPARSQATPQRI